MEMGREQQNVKVVCEDSLTESSGGRSISLRDKHGIFLKVDCEPVAMTSLTATGADEKEDNEEQSGISETVHSELEEGAEQECLTKKELLECHAKLAETGTLLTLESDLSSAMTEVSALKERLESEKGKSQKAWRLLCEQITQYDADMAEGDAEIARLKAIIAELEHEK